LYPLPAIVLLAEQRPVVAVLLLAQQRQPLGLS